MSRLLLFCFVVLLAACGGNSSSDSGDAAEYAPAFKEEKKKAADAASNKGVGQTTHVELNNPLDAAMVESGGSIYQLKCAACHKLTDQRVVGPGWAGITKKRTPEWIMNMTTNVDAMLAEDPVAQELLKECLVRMPNQNLTVADARDVLEFMYKNDGVPVAGE